MTDDEHETANGLGCMLLLLWLPALAFLTCWAAHCGWSMVK